MPRFRGSDRMARRRGKRGLTAEDEALWRTVAARTRPLHPKARDGGANAAAATAPGTPAKAPSRTAPAGREDTPGGPIPDFRVGQRADRTRPGHDLAPTISDRLATAPVEMDRKAFLRMKRGKLQIEGRIDLHGMTLDQAYGRLVGFIQSSHGKGRRLVLVITGKGRPGQDDGPIPQRPGVLKRQVPLWLRGPGLGGMVLQVSEAHRSHGGTGAYYVYLRRR